MKKERLLWILIIILIAVNGAALFYIVSPPRPQPGNKFDRTVIHELKLTNDQVKKFDIMKKAHHQELMRIDREMHSTYQRYFFLLIDSDNSTEKDSLETILSDMQKEKIRATYQHFDDLKRICTPEQKEKFKKLVPLLMHVISPQKNPGPPRRN